MTTTLSRREERARVRLLGEDVDRRPRDLAAREPLDQRRLVDQLAAGDVDDPHPVFHLRDLAPRRSGRACPAVRVAWSETKSASAKSVLQRSRPARRRAPGSARARRRGRSARTRISKPRARRATCWPILPKPTRPRVLSASSMPREARALPAALLERTVRLRDLAGEREQKARACARPPRRPSTAGRWRRGCPLSTRRRGRRCRRRRPARPITLRRSARSIRSAVTCVPLRMMIASYSPMRLVQVSVGLDVDVELLPEELDARFGDGLPDEDLSRRHGLGVGLVRRSDGDAALDVRAGFDERALERCQRSGHVVARRRSRCARSGRSCRAAAPGRR